MDVAFWRLTDGRKVWYEWMVETFSTITETPEKIESDRPIKEDSKSSATDNLEKIVQGRRNERLGVSDLCSSRKNGCLM